MKKNRPERQIHTFDAFFCPDAKRLILGSFPSVKSREAGFFYGHPQNRFWRVIAAVFGEDTPVDIEDKKRFLARNQIALWDTIQSCTITGSSDSSIRDVVPNDLNRILEAADVDRIYCNGAASHRLYSRYCMEETGREAIRLPSTSPANAMWSLERLIREWKKEIEP